MLQVQGALCGENKQPRGSVLDDMDGMVKIADTLPEPLGTASGPTSPFGIIVINLQETQYWGSQV